MMNKSGKSNLNLTDRDMQLLSEAAIAIKQSREKNATIQHVEVASYYENYDELNYYPSTIFTYDFSNAREFAKMLRDMWEHQGKDDMKDIVANCVASTYKYLDVKTTEDSKKSEISPFIYEF